MQPQTLTIEAVLGYTPPRPVTLTVDLDSLRVDIKREAGIESYVDNAAANDQHLKYLGAVGIVRDALRYLIANDRVPRGEGLGSPVPNLELQAVLEILDQASFDL